MYGHSDKERTHAYKGAVLSASEFPRKTRRYGICEFPISK